MFFNSICRQENPFETSLYEYIYYRKLKGNKYGLFFNLILVVDVIGSALKLETWIFFSTKDKWLPLNLKHVFIEV